MGQPKTKTVGGGSATPVANSWNQFLQGQLYQQPGAQAIPQAAAGGAQPNYPKPHGFQSRGSGNQPQQPNINPMSGPPGQFQQLLGSMMNPDYTGMINSNPFLSGALGYNPQAQMPNAPNFGYPGMQGQGGNVPPGTGGFNMQGGNPLAQPNLPNIAGGYNPSNAATMDPFSIMNGVGSGQNLLASYGIDINKFLNPASIGGGPNTGVNIPQASLLDTSKDPSFMAIQQIADRQKMNDIANLRQRYGMGGNTQSSGASLAESQYLAEANPRLVAGLGGLNRDIQGLDLQRQKMNMDAAGMANASAGGAAGAMANNMSQNFANILDFIQGTRGQDVGSASGLASQNLGNQQSANNLNASNLLQALGMDSSNLLNLFGQNSSNALNMFGQQSSNALNNQGMGNNWMSNLMGTGMGLQQLGYGGQQNALNNLFNSFNQSNQIGNPQAQIVQTPSPFSQIMGLAGSILPFIPGMQPAAMGANLLGGMGGGRPTMAPPQLNNPFSTPFVMPNYQMPRFP